MDEYKKVEVKVRFQIVKLEERIAPSSVGAAGNSGSGSAGNGNGNAVSNGQSPQPV